MAKRLQLKRQDGSAMIQIAQSRLTIHHLQPYGNWEDFRKLIIEVFKTYIDLCGDFSIKSIGLRYINHIVPPDSEGFQVDDFLVVLPLFPKPVNKFPMIGFQQTYQFLHDLPPASLLHRTGVIETPDKGTALLLDLSFVSLQIDNTLKDVSVLEWLSHWLEQAHEHIETAFISSLNPSYYESLVEG
jgi:uncharacterized protein (TIGR04255 family)